jgi:hypothetical protein
MRSENRELLKEFNVVFIKTANDGYVGSQIDEGRSKVR